MNEQQIRLHSVGTKIIRFEATTGKSFSLKKQNKTKQKTLKLYIESSIRVLYYYSPLIFDQGTAIIDRVPFISFSPDPSHISMLKSSPDVNVFFCVFFWHFLWTYQFVFLPLEITPNSAVLLLTIFLFYYYYYYYFLYNSANPLPTNSGKD